jgi:ubiquinone/menaquinone biosynthesis C-methylase UbiE
MSDLQYEHAAASGYDQAVGNLTRQLVPTLLKAALIKPGYRVLDVGSGTGLAAEGAAAIVGPSGHITASDISPAMLEQARRKLGKLPNVTFSVENAEALTFPDSSFDRVICNMAVMYFADPAQALAEMRRVLRPGGRVAISVNTSPDTSMISRVLPIIDRFAPRSKVRSGPNSFDGSERHLRSLFDTAGFTELAVSVETLRMPFPSFDAYFGGVEKGAGNVGQEYMALPEKLRRAVRDETRRVVGDTGGAIEVNVETTFASGQG